LFAARDDCDKESAMHTRLALTVIVVLSTVLVRTAADGRQGAPSRPPEPRIDAVVTDRQGGNP